MGTPPALQHLTGDVPFWPALPLDARPTSAQPGAMTDTTTTEHRCEALTISDIPANRCTTSATDDRKGRAVCASHARALRIRWFDDAADH
jgi:hypothetical protein